MNDIVIDIESIIKLFADDTSIYLSIDEPDRRSLILNSDLLKITNWAKKWKVSFNPSKNGVNDHLQQTRHTDPTTPIWTRNTNRDNRTQTFRSHSTKRPQMGQTYLLHYWKNQITHCMPKII